MTQPGAVPPIPARRFPSVFGPAIVVWAPLLACTPADRPPNVLSAAEIADGWTLLFNGQSTDGWERYGDGPFPTGGWRVVDGMLMAGANADTAGPRGDIVTRRSFRDFELRFEFKHSASANSGVFYRVVETPGLGMWSVAPEFQVLDDTAYFTVMDTTAHLTGDNYDLHVSARRITRPLGEWNTARIVVDGARVEHWLNGQATVTYALWSPEWDSLVAQSKFSPYEEYGRAREGRIGLQDHDPGHVWFRNIKIRPLR